MNPGPSTFSLIRPARPAESPDFTRLAWVPVLGGVRLREKDGRPTLDISLPFVFFLFSCLRSAFLRCSASYFSCLMRSASSNLRRASRMSSRRLPVSTSLRERSRKAPSKLVRRGDMGACDVLGLRLMDGRGESLGLCWLSWRSECE